MQTVLSVVRDLLRPRLILDRVDISTVVFVAIRIHFSIFAKEGALVERVFVRHISRL